MSQTMPDVTTRAQAVAAGLMTKFCADCRWVRPNRWYSVGGRWRYAKCTAPQARVRNGANLVDETLCEGGMCSVLREFEHCCGPTGAWWKAKP